MKKLLQVSVHSLPLLLGIVLSNLLWRSNSILFVVYLGILASFIYAGRDRKGEAYVALYGIAAALAVETIGTRVGGYQTFANPSFLGIPAWLPLAFAYGFVLMKRIALIISTGSPWTKANAS